MRTSFPAALAVTALVALCGCASIQSEHLNKSPSDSAEGLVYYMPKRDFIIQQTIGQPGTPISFEITPSPAYPDRNRAFGLHRRQNFIANNNDTLSVSQLGLLETIDSKSDPQIEATLDKLAPAAIPKDLNTINIDSGSTGGDEIECEEGVHTFRLEVRKTHPLCNGYQAEARVIDSPKSGGSDTNNDPGDSESEDSPRSGGSDTNNNPDDSKSDDSGLSSTYKSGKHNVIFYRQEQAVEVTITNSSTKQKTVKTQIHYSPSGAPIRALEVAKGFFADTNNNFGFKDGLLISANYKKDSELATLLTAPAKLIGAYTGALSQILSGLRNPARDRVAVMQEETQRNLLRAKIERCRAALEKNQPLEQTTPLCNFE
ncbi:hypothetical protein S4A8_02813 [Salinisphaera sp. S4-8]|uniref:hypothetical protein n=1 Tax=Salinisphaera sp. S4-8 TaxID=633357 RepID=UPI00333E749A